MTYNYGTEYSCSFKTAFYFTIAKISEGGYEKVFKKFNQIYPYYILIHCLFFRPDAKTSRSDTSVNNSQVIVNNQHQSSASDSRLHGSMNGDVRGHMDPYIMNNNEGESHGLLHHEQQ